MQGLMKWQVIQMQTSVLSKLRGETRNSFQDEKLHLKSFSQDFDYTKSPY